MADYWLAYKLFRIDKTKYWSKLGDVEGILPVYRTKKSAHEALGYAIELSRLKTEFPKKGVEGWKRDSRRRRT